MAEALKPLQAEFNRLERRHRLGVAAITIGVLTPLILLAGWLFARLRNRPLAPVAYAFGVAVLAKAFLVMHEYVPAEYFRYIPSVSTILVIGWLLVRLLLVVARPNRDTRLNNIANHMTLSCAPCASTPSAADRCDLCRGRRGHCGGRALLRPLWRTDSCLIAQSALALQQNSSVHLLTGLFLQPRSEQY